MAELRVDILTLFPDTVNAMLHESILGRAARKGILDLRCIQIRDYTENRQCQVDDYPYGGGFGCVMMAQPLKSCLDAVLSEAETRRRVIYLSPQGRPFTQETARRLQRDYDHLILVCGATSVRATGTGCSNTRSIPDRKSGRGERCRRSCWAATMRRSSAGGG